MKSRPSGETLLLMFEIVPHVADVRLRIEASTIEGLFEDAANALVSFCEVRSAPDNTECRDLTIESGDITSLLVDFLNEILSLLQIDRLVFAGFDTVDLGETKLEATVRCRRAETWHEDVKAVTYHEARITCAEGEWKTTIVLDI